jgi:hypothetical protein
MAELNHLRVKRDAQAMACYVTVTDHEAHGLYDIEAEREERHEYPWTVEIPGARWSVTVPANEADTWAEKLVDSMFDVTLRDTPDGRQTCITFANKRYDSLPSLAAAIHRAMTCLSKDRDPDDDGPHEFRNLLDSVITWDDSDAVPEVFRYDLIGALQKAHGFTIDEAYYYVWVCVGGLSELDPDVESARNWDAEAWLDHGRAEDAWSLPERTSVVLGWLWHNNLSAVDEYIRAFGGLVNESLEQTLCAAHQWALEQACATVVEVLLTQANNGWVQKDNEEENDV